MSAFLDFGNNVEIVKTKNQQKILLMANDSGQAIIDLIDVASGIQIALHNYNMAYTTCKAYAKKNLLVVDHCLEGIAEYTPKGKRYYSIKENDIVVSDRKNQRGDFYFPLKHYRGVSILFDLKLATITLKKYFPEFNISITTIKERYLRGNNFRYSFTNRYKNSFLDFYNIPKPMDKHYYLIKCIEVLFVLNNLNISDNQKEPLYFYKAQIEKIKDIHDLLINNLQDSYTLDELSKIYAISLTMLKTCFKEFYGQPVFTYLRNYRLNIACSMLQTTTKPIAKIAYETGFTNPSKFSYTFKKNIGVTPKEYRLSGSKEFRRKK